MGAGGWAWEWLKPAGGTIAGQANLTAAPNRRVLATGARNSARGTSLRFDYFGLVGPVASKRSVGLLNETFCCKPQTVRGLGARRLCFAKS